MRNLIAVVLAVMTLAGCVAVPVHHDPYPGGYYYAPPAPDVYFRYDHHHHRHRR